MTLAAILKDIAITPQLRRIRFNRDTELMTDRGPDLFYAKDQEVLCRSVKRMVHPSSDMSHVVLSNGVSAYISNEDFEEVKDA